MDPHLLALQNATTKQGVEDNKGKAAILAKKFFLIAGEADLSNLKGEL